MVLARRSWVSGPHGGNGDGMKGIRVRHPKKEGRISWGLVKMFTSESQIKVKGDG